MKKNTKWILENKINYEKNKEAVAKLKFQS